MTRSTAFILSTSLAFSPLLPSASPVEAAPKASKPVIRVGAFSYDPEQTLITLPLKGAVPTWRVIHERRSRVAYLEIPADGTLIARTGRTQSLNPTSGLLSRILFAQNRPGVVRIAVRGREAVRMLPELVDGANGKTLHLRFEPFEKPEPAPRPKATPISRPPSLPEPSPMPTSAPPSPEPALGRPPAKTPAIPSDPEATAIAQPTPLPTPSPTPEAPEPPSRIEISRYAQAFHEDYAAGSANNIQVPNLGVTELTWTQQIDASWRTRLNYKRWDPYTIVDVDLVGSSHVRNENWLEAGLERRAQTGSVAHALGLGYYMRDVRVQNTLEAIAPEYLFSSTQFYHGLMLFDTMTLRLWGPFRLVGGLQIRPLNFAHVEVGVPEMPWLVAGGGDLGLEYSQHVFGHWLSARLSQRYEAFHQTTSVPFQAWSMTALSLGYRF